MTEVKELYDSSGRRRCISFSAFIMSRSDGHIFVGGALNIIQDLSDGSNLPFLRPLANLAVRIHTSAEGAKSNKSEAQQLAKDVYQTVQEILQVFPIVPSPPMTSPFGISKNGLEQFRRTLEGMAIAAERIAAQNTLRRFLNQQNDKEQLATYQIKLMAAMVQLLLSMNIGELQARRDETYPVFTETNLDPQEVLNPPQVIRESSQPFYHIGSRP
ncbi:hypothetical protein B0H13DRAFT_2364872 [Mycena leptocephala]|nr:hypothetical protein B0H13DRAFT_2364872 [Mycena leptocephala]